LVSTKGIEANPDKIKALVEMQDPISVKDVEKLTGRVAALNRIHPQSRGEKFSFLPSSLKFQEISVVRILEASFPRTQRLPIKHDQAMPSRTKITTLVVLVCF
jgi:hypothetical protein